MYKRTGSGNACTHILSKHYCNHSDNSNKTITAGRCRYSYCPLLTVVKNIYFTDHVCPKCDSIKSDPCGRGGRICHSCGCTYGAD